MGKQHDNIEGIHWTRVHPYDPPEYAEVEHYSQAQAFVPLDMWENKDMPRRAFLNEFGDVPVKVYVFRKCYDCGAELPRRIPSAIVLGNGAVCEQCERLSRGHLNFLDECD